MRVAACALMLCVASPSQAARTVIHHDEFVGDRYTSRYAVSAQEVVRTVRQTRKAKRWHRSPKRFKQPRRYIAPPVIARPIPLPFPRPPDAPEADPEAAAFNAAWDRIAEGLRPRKSLLQGLVDEIGRAFLNTVAAGESPSYNVIYGGRRFEDYADHPRVRARIVAGRNRGRYSDAAGRYQFLSSTWKWVKTEAGLSTFDPDSQDVAAWYLAKVMYAKRSGGRDLHADLLAFRDNVGMLTGIGRRLAGVWTSLPGGIEPNGATRGFAARLQRELPIDLAAAKHQSVYGSCHVAGDSIGVGLRGKLPCTNVSRGAMPSGAIIGYVRPADILIVVSGSNDDRKHPEILARNLDLTCARATGAVIFVLPANWARPHVQAAAKRCNAWTVDFVLCPHCRDRVHPMSYRALAEDIKAAMEALRAERKISAARADGASAEGH